MVEEANLRKGVSARLIKPAMAPIEGKKKKTMVVKPPAPYLLLAVLAVLSGRTTGEMTCFSQSGAYLLRDTAKCWAPEINQEFGGTLDGCSNGRPYGSSNTCAATVAKINADGSSYTGPDISCYEFNGLKWNSDDDCKKGVQAMMAVLDPPATTTATTTTTTIDYTGNDIFNSFNVALDGGLKKAKNTVVGIYVGAIVGGIVCCALCAAGIYYMTKGNNPKQDAAPAAI
jgi:hypothetical protein